MTYLLTPHLLEDRLPDLGCPHHHPSVHQTKPEGVADVVTSAIDLGTNQELV